MNFPGDVLPRPVSHTCNPILVAPVPYLGIFLQAPRGSNPRLEPGVVLPHSAAALHTQHCGVVEVVLCCTGHSDDPALDARSLAPLATPPIATYAHPFGTDPSFIPYTSPAPTPLFLSCMCPFPTLFRRSIAPLLPNLTFPATTPTTCFPEVATSVVVCGRRL